MATVDKNFDVSLLRAQRPSLGEPRHAVGLHLRWGAVLGGVVIGWGTMFLLSLIGSAIGAAAMDPMAPRPWEGLGTGAGIWGAVSMIISSLVGGYFAVRLSGERRRPDALLHGGTAWALSVVVGAILAMLAASTAAVASAPTANRKAAQRGDRVTTTDRARADEAGEQAGKAGGLAAGGAILALACSLLGGLAAAGRMDGRSLKEELTPPRRRNGDMRHLGHTATPREVTREDLHRENSDRPTILPPQ